LERIKEFFSFSVENCCTFHAPKLHFAVFQLENKSATFFTQLWNCLVLDFSVEIEGKMCGINTKLMKNGFEKLKYN